MGSVKIAKIKCLLKIPVLQYDSSCMGEQSDIMPVRSNTR